MDSEDAPAILLTAVSEVLVPEVLRLTRPVFAQHADGSLELLGSGVVIDAATNRYLLTASHLVNRVGNARLTIGVGGSAREVRGKRCRVTTADALPGAEGDRADVTVIRLEGDAATWCPDVEVVPLSLVEFDPKPDIRNPLLLLGFPCTKNENALRDQTFDTKAYSVVVFEIEHVEYAALMIDRSSHLSLSLDRKDVWNHAGRRMAPSLHGLSGSGVWRTSVFGDRPNSSVTLAGIFTEHYQKAKTKHLVATRLATVLEVVARSDSDLRAALAEVGVHVA